jgi:hypothetical protein
MATINRLNHAGIRRLRALYPQGRRSGARATAVRPEISGLSSTEELEQRFADYILDPTGRPIVARAAADEHWFASSLLLDVVAPANAVAVGDDIAAIIAAPKLVTNERLSERLMQHRFAPRADDAVAAAVTLLPLERARTTVLELALQPGRDEDLIHLALLQAGRALAWRPELLEAENIGPVVDTLLGLLDRKNANPLLNSVAPILGAMAAVPSSVGKHVRDAIIDKFGGARSKVVDRRTSSSFSGEFKALDQARAIPDEDYYQTLPDRNLLEACARALGRATENMGHNAFVTLQSAILEGELAGALLPSFVDGLIEAASIEPLSQLVSHLLASPDAESRMLALQIGTQIPLDGCTDAYLHCLEDGRKQVRAAATRAVVFLEPEQAVPALVARLDDPEPSVCAAAATALALLGQEDVVRSRDVPREFAIGKSRERTAAARAAVGDTSTEVISILLPLVAEEVEHATEGEATELLAAFATALRKTPDGIRLIGELAGEIREILPLLVLALVADDGSAAVTLPAELRAELAKVLDPIIDGEDDESGVFGLQLLARFSLGDAAMLERILAFGERVEGRAGEVLNALAHVQRRSPRAGKLIGPLVADHEHLPGAVTAAAVGGFVLTDGDPAWGKIRELYGLGTLATAVVHSALVNGARVRGD